MMMDINTAKTLILAAHNAWREEIGYSLIVGKVTIASYQARVAQRAALAAECQTAMLAAVECLGQLVDFEIADLQTQPAVRAALSTVAGWQKRNLQTA
tara:strand:- start:273 stop:566 length:294 start_codon:yes stop_codon:yes gene_type:complete